MHPSDLVILQVFPELKMVEKHSVVIKGRKFNSSFLLISISKDMKNSQSDQEGAKKDSGVWLDFDKWIILVALL